MNLWKIARSNLAFRPLNTILSVILLGFGVGIISLLILLQDQLQDQFDKNINNIDMVLGAKGSPLQLILANVYHIDVPTGNINLEEAKKIMKHPYVDKAIPLAYGDNYQRFRIVGCELNYPEHYEVSISEGRSWEDRFEVVIGSAVADEAGLKIGDEFYSSHGLTDDSDVHKNHAFKVVGIYASSGSVIDQLILCNIESIWGVHENLDVPEDDRPENEITAVLLTKKNPLAVITLPNYIRDTNMQLALPAIEINRLNQNFGLGMKAATAIAGIIMILSFISVFISLFNSLKDRKYELALMRTMGGSNKKLFGLIVLEGMTQVFIGLFAGLVLSRIGLFFLSWAVENQFHYDLNAISILPFELVLIGITIFVGILASLLPAISAVNIDISKTLSDG